MEKKEKQIKHFGELGPGVAQVGGAVRESWPSASGGGLEHLTITFWQACCALGDGQPEVPC